MFKNIFISKAVNEKDGPGPVTVSDTAVHILGTQNVHSRIKGTADYLY